MATSDDYLDTHNADRTPFTWTASAESTIEKVSEDGPSSSKRLVNSGTLH